MHPSRLVTAALVLCALGAPATAAPEPATPGRAYLRYCNVLQGAMRYEEILPFCSAAHRGRLERALRHRHRKLPPHALAQAQRQALSTQQRMFFDPAEPVEVIQEQVRGNRAVLVVEGILPISPSERLGQALPLQRLAQATVVMVRERGAWRVDLEKIMAVAAPPERAPAGAGRATMPPTPPSKPAPPAAPAPAPGVSAPVLPSPMLY